MKKLVLIISLFGLNLGFTKDLEIDLKYSTFGIKKKKNKITLICKPLQSFRNDNYEWVKECNNAAFNLLNSEKYQNILDEEYIEDEPFGKLSYRAIEESGSFMHRKALRKSFKLKKK